MGSLAQAKTLGGVGSILLVLGLVPSVGFILGIAGFILVLVAVKYIADATGKRAIYSNMIIAVIMAIIGMIIAMVLVFGALYAFLGVEVLEGVIPPLIEQPDITDMDFIAFLGALILGLILFWIFFMISAVFLKKSFKAISSTLNVGMFGTAGLLYLIGAILIVVVVGIVLILVAQILMIVAFFSMPEQPPAAAPA